MALVYTPVLIALLPLLVVGSVFATVTGGFLVVLTGVYYVVAGLLALGAQAVRVRARARRGRREVADRLLATPSPYSSPPIPSGRMGHAPAPVALGRGRLVPAPAPLLRDAGPGGIGSHSVVDVDRGAESPPAPADPVSGWRRPVRTFPSTRASKGGADSGAAV